MPLHDIIDTLELADFRIAEARDIPGLVDIYQMFFADSTLPSLGLAFDPKKTTTWLERSIMMGSPLHLVAVEKETGKILGSFDYVLDGVFAEPCACLDKFYVRSSWRFSAVGRTLLALALEMARGDGAVAFRAGLSSGVPGSRNVFDRLGFREVSSSVLMERKL